MNRAELLKIAKPILFNLEMTQAILDDRKSATRRVLKLPKWIWWTDKENGFMNFATDNEGYGDSGKLHISQLQDYYSSYKVGDYLYVRETGMIQSMKNFGKKVKILFKADNSLVEFDLSDKEYERLSKWESLKKWLSPYWLTKETARIFLRVTAVRIERLQDITEEQAIKEGCEGLECSCHGTAYACTDCYNTGWLEPPQVDFIFLWNSTIKKQDIDKYGWDANPWVIVVEFERVVAE